MKNHFIENVEFKNFKCFKELHVKNLKRVNLISGKNNIGKTSLMEAIELLVSSNDSIELAHNTYQMMTRRQKTIRNERYFELDFIHSGENFSILEVNNKRIEIEYTEQLLEKTINERDYYYEGEKELLNEYVPALKFFLNGDERIFPIDRFFNSRIPLLRRDKFEATKLKINFISSTTTDERDIAILYGNLIDINNESFLNESLQYFDENILSLKQKATERDIVLKIQLKNREMPILLSSLGEGINRYIAILCAIWSSKNGFLFIDEIENGIHYTNYKKLWRIVFEASRRANCQIFVTTHSKECIEAFNEINEYNDGSFFEIYKNAKNGELFSRYRDNEQLKYSLYHTGEFRGE